MNLIDKRDLRGGGKLNFFPALQGKKILKGKMKYLQAEIFTTAPCQFSTKYEAALVKL